MADSRKGFIVELTGVLSGYDTRSVQQVAQDIQKQFSKVGTFKFDKKDINEARKYYASLWKDAATFQKQYNTSVANGATDMQRVYTAALIAVNKEISNMNQEAAKHGVSIASSQSKYWEKAKNDASSGSKFIISQLKSVKKEQDKVAKTKGSDFLTRFKDGLLSSQSGLNAFSIGVSVTQKALQLFSQFCQKAINDIKELNTAMTSVQMVTGKTGSDAYDMFNEYNSLAKELSVATKTVVEGADDWFNIRPIKTM